MTTPSPGIERSAATWRELPTLSMHEAATILGVCQRTLEAHLEDEGIETVRYGRRRLVVTRSLREWLGELQPEAPSGRPAPSPRVATKADHLLRRLG